ncbi:hypothetical protein LTS18_004570 [Coniosporium uncinatum]|uniref:Uncharacterized protein n=1 Tax=Coniosporium uncinatum TaxID=93489 RepID=A0ACC3D5J0_9PEZI|nr:hypothetical protein LTS18_004570 [Coniosporium uncinatum]
MHVFNRFQRSNNYTKEEEEEFLTTRGEHQEPVYGPINIKPATSTDDEDTHARATVPRSPIVSVPRLTIKFPQCSETKTPLLDATGIIDYLPAQSTGDALHAQLVLSPSLAAISTPQWEEVQFSLDKGVGVSVARDSITPDSELLSPKSGPRLGGPIVVCGTKSVSTPDSTSSEDDAAPCRRDALSPSKFRHDLLPTDFSLAPRDEDEDGQENEDGHERAYQDEDATSPPSTPPPHPRQNLAPDNISSLHPRPPHPLLTADLTHRTATLTARILLARARSNISLPYTLSLQYASDAKHVALRTGDNLLVARAEFWVGRALFAGQRYGDAATRFGEAGKVLKRSGYGLMGDGGKGEEVEEVVEEMSEWFERARRGREWEEVPRVVEGWRYFVRVSKLDRQNDTVARKVMEGRGVRSLADILKDAAEYNDKEVTSHRAVNMQEEVEAEAEAETEAEEDATPALLPHEKLNITHDPRPSKRRSLMGSMKQLELVKKHRPVSWPPPCTPLAQTALSIEVGVELRPPTVRQSGLSAFSLTDKVDPISKTEGKGS